MGAFTISSTLNLSNPRPSYTETRRVTMASKTTLDSSGFSSVVSASNFKQPGQLLETFSRTTPLGTMCCRSLSVVPVNRSVLDVFDVTMNADTDYQWLVPKAGTGSRQYVLPVTTEFEANEREAELWRREYTVQPEKNKNDTTTDIGGNSTTTGGKPLIQKVKVIDVRVSFMIDTANGPANLIAVYDTISNVKNKWNSAQFLYWPANQVFCTGAQITNVREEIYRITYSFRWDAWFDCVQEPKRDRQGTIYFDSGTDDPSDVYWRSDYRDSFDLNSIYNDSFDSTIAKEMAREGSFLA